MLICRRRRGDFLGGYWEFPGGKRKPEEVWAACLRRELKEELGVSVRAIRRLARLRYRYRDRTIVFQVFRCVLASGRPRPLDADALRWVAPRQLARYRFPPANAPLVRRLAGTLPVGDPNGIMMDAVRHHTPRRRA